MALNVESLRPAPASLLAALAYTRKLFARPRLVLPACALVAVVMVYALEVDGTTRVTRAPASSFLQPHRRVYGIRTFEATPDR